MEDERKWSGRLFQITRAATLKLRLPSSVDLHVTQNGDRLGQRDSPWVSVAFKGFHFGVQI